MKVIRVGRWDVGINERGTVALYGRYKAQPSRFHILYPGERLVDLGIFPKTVHNAVVRLRKVGAR